MTNRYKHHRFPVTIISHAVWLYFRFCLSYFDVEELLFARGVIITHEAIREWCVKFGQHYANQLWHRRPRPGNNWHLDEILLTINGARYYLWRAMDQDGNMLAILVQRRRDKKAAQKFFRKLLNGCQTAVQPLGLPNLVNSFRLPKFTHSALRKRCGSSWTRASNRLPAEQWCHSVIYGCFFVAINAARKQGA